MDIEGLAVSAVEGLISKTDRLVSYIKSEEKEPMWDGSIYAYSSSGNNKRNEDYIGKAPVQIKGVTSGNINTEEVLFDIETIALKNYKKEGGVLFFVVVIDANRETEVYCRKLAPFVIKNILEGKESQKSIRVKFESFPCKVNDICNYVTNFIRDCKKQKIFEQDIVPSLEEFMSEAGKNVKFGFQVSRYGYEQSDPQEFLIGKEFFIYATNTKLNIDFPIQYIYRLEKTFQEIEMPVIVDGIMYYDHITYVLSEDGFEIHVGKSTEVNVIKEKGNPQISFNLKGNIKEQIQDSNFLINFLNTRKMEIGERSVYINPTEKEKEEFHIKDLQARHDYLKMIDSLLISLGIYKPLDIDALSEKDKEYLRMLEIAFIRKQSVHFNDAKLPAVGGVKIGNLNILLHFRDAGEGYYIIENFPDVKIDVEGEYKNGERFKTSKYVILKADDLIQADNFKFSQVVDDLMSIQNDGHFSHCNFVLLEMIAAFDKTKKEEFLDEATRLAKWLLSAECLNGISEINYFQCLFRKGEFGDEQKERLFVLLNEYKDDDQMLAAIHILLGNNTMVEHYMDKLEDEKKERFMTFPIYYLYANIV